ncbi:MAG TPA: hypothetical protein VGN88_06585 [Phycisphaerae bacterium]
MSVLFRRGPKDWTRMILWDTDSDTFTGGQWVKHRVEHGHLSPDGELLVYSVHNFRAHEKYGNWVAVSRPPYFTALAFWPASWPGGHGIFTGNRRLELFGFINDRKEGADKMPLSVVRHEMKFPVEPRLTGPEEWDRSEPKSRRWTLCWKSGRQRDAGDADRTFNTSYAVEVGTSFWPLEGADWATFDQRSRLVISRKGQLFVANVSPSGIQEKQLADFSAEKPDPTAPEAIAHRWPKRK